MSSVWIFGVVLGAVALVRLGEVLVSARRLRERDAVREPFLFPLMVLLHVASLSAPLAEVLLLGRPFRPWLCAVAVAVLALATVLRVWTLYTVRRSWNVRVVVPDPDTVVTTGPYAWIRHPNYLVVILELAALPLLHGAWLSAVGLTLLNAFVLTLRIRTEEAALSELPTWRDAMRTRKRLVPGLF
ncbi:MAG: isoprenylcysteine carboxylmethyltransferase family protein [Planctomycetota bacterium]